MQRLDGGLTIGDTHAYDEPFDFALSEEPTTELLGPGRRILGTELPSVRRRWEGVYAQCTDGAVCLREEIDDRRVDGDRAGRSGHDVLPGHRRRHPRGGGRGGMIGPFALACLDMAGTTVRDDGVVERAFDQALAAVGIDGGHRLATTRPTSSSSRRMGWSKADVFAHLLEPDEAQQATAQFASAYESIVASGAVVPMPGAAAVLRRAAGPRGQGLPHDGLRPLDPRRPARRARTGAPASTWRSRRPTSVGAARHRT